jgi:hypothetical protein
MAREVDAGIVGAEVAGVDADPGAGFGLPASQAIAWIFDGADDGTRAIDGRKPSWLRHLRRTLPPPGCRPGTITATTCPHGECRANPKPVGPAPATIGTNGRMRMSANVATPLRPS